MFFQELHTIYDSYVAQKSSLSAGAQSQSCGALFCVEKSQYMGLRYTDSLFPQVMPEQTRKITMLHPQAGNSSKEYYDMAAMSKSLPAVAGPTLECLVMPFFLVLGSFPSRP